MTRTKLRTIQALHRILGHLFEVRDGVAAAGLIRAVRGDSDLTASDYDRAIQMARRKGYVKPGIGKIKRGERPTYRITQAGRDAYRGNE